MTNDPTTLIQVIHAHALDLHNIIVHNTISTQEVLEIKDKVKVNNQTIGIPSSRLKGLFNLARGFPPVDTILYNYVNPNIGGSYPNIINSILKNFFSRDDKAFLYDESFYYRMLRNRGVNYLLDICDRILERKRLALNQVFIDCTKFAEYDKPLILLPEFYRKYYYSISSTNDTLIYSALLSLCMNYNISSVKVCLIYSGSYENCKYFANRSVYIRYLYTNTIRVSFNSLLARYYLNYCCFNYKLKNLYQKSSISKFLVTRAAMSDLINLEALGHISFNNNVILNNMQEFIKSGKFNPELLPDDLMSIKHVLVDSLKLANLKDEVNNFSILEEKEQDIVLNKVSSLLSQIIMSIGTGIGKDTPLHRHVKNILSNNGI